MHNGSGSRDTEEWSGHSFLRLQAVAHKAPAGANPKDLEQLNKPANLSSARARYLAIDSSPDAPKVADLLGSSQLSCFTNKDLIAAVQEMDRPEDWKKLMCIGKCLACHFKEEIGDWVQEYILQVPVLPEQPALPEQLSPASTAAAVTQALAAAAVMAARAVAAAAAGDTSFEAVSALEAATAAVTAAEAAASAAAALSSRHKRSQAVPRLELGSPLGKMPRYLMKRGT